jgi:hypothetical protein
MNTLQVVAERVKTMSSDEFRKSLIEAGILSVHGKLTSNYVKEKKYRAKD